ncbi:MAG: stage V sporulation protein AA [Lachnospiraceae bacterium]|nr:stage V sporulation protein AA [Lachnospiraceae bacterium]
MEKNTLYLKLSTKVRIQREVILLKDIAKIYHYDREKEEKIKAMEIYRFQQKDQNRCVISLLKVISLLQNQDPNLEINSLGDSQVIVEKESTAKSNTIVGIAKIGLVSAVCFFGTIFTVMAYHNDINIIGVFERVKEIVGTNPEEKITALEISYSLGLSLGIIIFYNHIGKRTLTKDPTPVAVEMRTYEADINKSLVELAEREGKIIENH